LYQRQAGPAQPGAELAAAQERREPAGAGQQVDRLADDRLLERRPGRAGVGGGGARLAAGARAFAGAAAPVQLHAQTDQVLQRAGVHVAGYDRGHRRIAGDRLGVEAGPGAGP
jgi:hypothetical protein